MKTQIYMNFTATKDKKRPKNKVVSIEAKERKHMNFKIKNTMLLQLIKKEVYFAPVFENVS